jgi:hypothetical protein
MPIDRPGIGLDPVRHLSISYPQAAIERDLTPALAGLAGAS